MRRNSLLPRLFISILVLGGLFPRWSAQGQSNSDCLECHSDKDLKNDKGNSLYVDLARYKSSSHGRAELSCVDCHADLAGIKDYPHTSPLKPAQCSSCHQDVESVYRQSPHGKLLLKGSNQGPTCLSCHGQSHAMVSGLEAKSACLTCHQSVKTMLQSSAHGAAPGACAECHGTHSLKPLKSGPEGGCRDCHKKEADAYAAGPHGVARAADNVQAPDCVGCHGGTHAVSRLAQAREACQNCHPGRAEAVASSVHGEIFGKNGSPSSVCYKCHTGHQVYQQKGRNRATCGGCHQKIEHDYEQSLHGYALAKNIKDAPDCTGCHDDHHILPVKAPASPINRRNIHTTCGKCHGKESVLAEGQIRMPRAAMTYEGSVHGQAVSRGLEKAATCLDCHGDHSLKGAGDPISTINVNNISHTCGNCHPSIRDEYEKSIHGRALQAGITDSPTCTGCHGEHQILSPEDPESPTSASHQAAETCARCHNDPVIINKYGLEGSVVKTYEDSYHGLAVRWQSQRAATCSDCHTSHRVQPALDSTSTVFAANVVHTCSRCHPGASANFAQSYTHSRLGRLESPLNVIVRNTYVILLVVIIGGMVIHNLIILNWHMRRAKLKQAAGAQVTRFDRLQVVQHLVLTISFIGLAVTGFALKFPDAWWVDIMNYLGMAEVVRGTLHRIFAVFLVGFGVFHIAYINLSQHGREEFYAMIPTFKDAKDVFQSIGFYLGWRKDPPLFNRYEYSQKGEYWALVWGTLLMALTGFILWFPVKFMSILPVWAIEVSQTIHYYEAWLATLAIIVWHFFFVVFHPEMYPMSWTWLTGKMSAREVKKHHTLWYHELVNKGKIKPQFEEEDDEDTHN